MSSELEEHQMFVGGEKPGFFDKFGVSTRSIGRNPVSEIIVIQFFGNIWDGNYRWLINPLLRNLVIQEYIENTKMCIQFFGWVGAGLLIFGMVIIDGWLTRPYGIW
ncbi:MAG: hypothetical protein JGK15_25005 [Microcoleus sp. PH2017_33_LGB_O_A]|uniref:hypothetical protein n=1 Tax=Microcoleus sp. PH2017_33_LGB_O_A TaxID=2798843 RepID=UPI001DE3BBB6|nr:hypothetical protein [Microcoleus sp. PH2017_33_LGB_O_A]MCC3643837.1 hypothetical protein [Microcoleus sp. PH2017_33_LGB_O_A]